MLWFKKQTVPVTNETKEIEIVQTWEVRWESHEGRFNNYRPEVAVFTSEEEAATFAESLRAAFRLLRYSAGHLGEDPTKVEMQKSI